MMLFAHYRKKTADIIKPSIALPLINSCTSIFAALTVYSYIGHMADVEDLDVSELELEGPKLAFIAYPNALTLMPGTNIWSILFFIMLVTLGMDS